MKEKLSKLVDKALAKGMEILDSERAQQIMASKQVQGALEWGLKTLGTIQETSDKVKAGIVDKLGVATKEDLEDLRQEIQKSGN